MNDFQTPQFISSRKDEFMLELESTLRQEIIDVTHSIQTLYPTLRDLNVDPQCGDDDE